MVITSTELVKSPWRFIALYYDLFGKVLDIKKEVWPKFVEYIADKAVEGDIEETGPVIAADILFEEMCATMTLTLDKELLNQREMCHFFVYHNPHGKAYFVVPSAAIDTRRNNKSIHISMEDVSAAMTARKYKLSNTFGVKVTGTNIRCWWFYPQALEEQGMDLTTLGVVL
ncbi:hypothetical protein [Methanosalsum natronophilum]|uniref:hypothetical protein n=1 Tax=Methanosalsum natronophilum TaxID=768733 RepID=UPI0021684E7E|nr:hypothetical protein [Methanosalsum natronophilum]MCS3924905.1 hypothetical protein [Methanosalsum natronophilum]